MTDIRTGGNRNEARGKVWDEAQRLRRVLAVAALVLMGAGAPGGASRARPGEAPGGPASPGDQARTMARARYLMGCVLSIEVPASAGEAPIEAAFKEVRRLEVVMSNWKEDSEIARLNRAAWSRPFVCSADLFGAVASALHWAGATGGAFDPTVEPLVRRLGLRGVEGRLPGDEEPCPNPGAAPGTMAGAGVGQTPIGWRHVLLDERTHSVRFEWQGMGLDLGGIGKGIALDAAARVLKDGGVQNALLDFGGQVLALGSSPDAPGWPVGVADPEDRARAAVGVMVHDASLATSGNGERSVPGPAGPVGHILDPARGTPAEFRGTVTVLAQDATAADALSTALFVMGPERGARWAAERGLAVLYLWRHPDGTLAENATAAFGILRQGGADRRGPPHLAGARDRD
jgi:FAD:protein FMN transferase